MASTLAALIRDRREELLAEWEANVRTLASAAHASSPALFDNVPALLDWLCERLDHPDAPEDDRDAFTQRHAMERIDQGFDLVEVVAELALLRECLLSAWETAPEGIVPAEIRLVDAELDQVVARVVVQFVQGVALPVSPAP